LVVLQSLAVLREAGAADALLKALGDSDREIRLTGAWGLARLGAASSVAPLLKAAETQEPWERVKATQACLLLAENLAAGGQTAQAVRIYTHLRDTRTDPKELYLREIAAKALEKLGAGKKLT
jgi:HEAT repeat protein